MTALVVVVVTAIAVDATIRLFGPSIKLVWTRRRQVWRHVRGR